MILEQPKISDVIKALQMMQAQLGDLPVKSSDPGGYWPRSIVAIEDCQDLQGLPFVSIEGDG